MKKMIVLLGIFCSTAFFSQCTIEGKSRLNVSESATYSVANELAQCKDCHQWNFLGNNLEKTSDTRQNVFHVKSVAGGNSTISVTVLTPRGIEQCSKSIEIVSDVNSSENFVDNSKKPECDISVNNFKEVKNEEGVVSFIPNKLTADYSYNWEATLSTGNTLKSEEIVPQFNYTLDNPINVVKLKIYSKKCIRELEKKYDNNFWSYFK